MGKRARLKAARKRDRELAEANNPLGAVARYADAETVFGRAIEADELIHHIKGFAWREGFIRLAHVAAAVANDNAGPKNPALQRWARDSLDALTGSSTTLIARAKWWAKSGDQAVVFHEEALDYAMHLVLLYGLDDGPCPSDCELVLWVIGCSQLIGKWEVDDSSNITASEALIAEQSRVARFNNGEDPLTLLVRVADLFGNRPFTGKLADPATWAAIEQKAFGRTFAEHFETRVLPWFSQSLRWGKSHDELPVIDPEAWVKKVGETGKQIVAWLWEQTRTREQLVDELRATMGSASVPRSPTTLLHHPLVKFSDDRIAVTSPWKILAYLRTGIWFAFLEACKSVLGKNGAQDWTSAFGYMFEKWLRSVARFAETKAFKGRLLLSKHPGSEDEIDDVVVLEGNTVVLFSAKARLVGKDVARDAKSKKMVIDWYRSFLFSEEKGAFRVGAVRQFDANINKIRAGAFPEVPKDARIVPVLVTYDTMCEEYLLYEWIQEQCTALGLLQQENVTPLSIAHVYDFERLFGRASRGLSLAQFFRDREGPWKGRRIQNQIGVTAPADRLKQLEGRFVELMDSMSMRRLGKPLSDKLKARVMRR